MGRIKGFNHSKEVKIKIGEGNKDKIVSIETRRKISEGNKGRIPWNQGLVGFIKGHKHSEETKIKIGKANSIALRGKKASEETKEKMSESHKIAHQKKNWGFSKGHITKYWQGKRGEGTPNWQGGKSLEPYSVYWTDDLKESIRKRDEYVCQLCGIHQDELEIKLDVHHIDYDKKNLNPDNLISLCKSCHMKTNAHRDYWNNYLTGFFFNKREILKT